jgi:hypothetical protein
VAGNGRTIDGAALERLIDESPLSMAELGREFARLRLKRKPTEREASNARSQIQKLIRLDGGVTPRTVRLLSQVLDADGEAFLYPAALPPATPIALMQEVMANQEQILGRLESFEKTIDGASRDVAATLARLASEIHALSERKRDAKQPRRRADAK